MANHINTRFSISPLKVNIQKKNGIYDDFSCIKQSIHSLFDQRPAHLTSADVMNYLIVAYYIPRK